MSILLSKLGAAAGVLLAAAVLCSAPAGAAEPKKKPSKSAVAKAKAAKSTAPGAAARTGNPDEDEPDVKDTVTVEYQCELNNKVTIYRNEGDDSHIALRWKNRLHRLTRVGTTTGALRFENPFWGLIWIGIPAKGILLDSKLNRQLANECKTPEQATVATPPVRQG
ncbi:hypothetical protein E4L96_11970 [Massilia arenosa]|uniref:C-type lysozyme inhibitor domain-containing protein n=1 Tax=Zemynaea arenosa TaxID=2561931 RepID=A0A4Y9SEX2_9BURK|nr:hypothetical protein [Massilia arenosa]TFW19342.1 hypothetical protein E4L96_11970 [Massilia arenosa]